MSPYSKTEVSLFSSKCCYRIGKQKLHSFMKFQNAVSPETGKELKI
jgi:hypothetical protein